MATVDPGRGSSDTLLEYTLPSYDPKLQDRGFMETSCYVHVLTNELYRGYDYVGICQYDMRWTPSAVAALRELALGGIRRPDVIYGISVGALCDRGGRPHPLAFPDKVNWAYLLGSYNSNFGKNHQSQIFIERPLSLFQTYLMPTTEFVALASWLRVLCDDLHPDHCRPPYETHWGGFGWQDRAGSSPLCRRPHAGRRD